MKRGLTAWLILLGPALYAGACAKILGLDTQDESRPFEHRAHVLEGINCLECHAEIQSAGDAGPLHLPTDASCVSCHQDPHDPNPCGNCHGRAQTRHAAEMAKKHLLFSHQQHDEQGAGDCVRCHVDVKQDADFLRPNMATCFSCHEHKDQWDTRDCDGCHVDLHSEGTLPESHLVHSGDFLREHGMQAASQGELCVTCHTERQCAACHGVTVADIPSRLAFDEPLRRSMHRANFIAVHSREAAINPGMCTVCHAELFCVECHMEEGLAGMNPERGNPHPPGWSGPPGAANTHGEAARLDPLSCASCHGGAGEMLCVGCHLVGGPGGNPHPAGFSSRLSMTDDLPCRLCHVGGR